MTKTGAFSESIYKIATDLIISAVDDKYDIAVVVSSDADIIPAIDLARNRAHKKIGYIGFSITDDKDEKICPNYYIQHAPPAMKCVCWF